MVDQHNKDYCYTLFLPIFPYFNYSVAFVTEYNSYGSYILHRTGTLTGTDTIENNISCTGPHVLQKSIVPFGCILLISIRCLGYVSCVGDLFALEVSHKLLTWITTYSHLPNISSFPVNSKHPYC